MILLPKVKEGYSGIGLVEVIWKIITGIIKNCPRTDILFHDSLQRFGQVGGAGTAMLEAKLKQHLA